MPHQAGKYLTTSSAGESVKAFVPHPLPPSDPPLDISAGIDRFHTQAVTALARLTVAGNLVPSTDWFPYGFPFHRGNLR